MKETHWRKFLFDLKMRKHFFSEKKKNSDLTLKHALFSCYVLRKDLKMLHDDDSSAFFVAATLELHHI